MDNNSDIESESESCGCFVFSLKNGEREFNLQLNEEYSIGSASDANIRLTSKDSVLDPTHSVVEVTENGIATIIIKSTAQPLTVNGIKVEAFKVLKDNDVIEVIEKKFRYYTDFVAGKEIDKYAEDNFDMLKSKSILIPESAKKLPSPQKPSTVKSRIPTRVPLTKSILKSRRKSESAFNRKISPVLTRKISTSVKKFSDKSRKPSSAKKSHTFASKSTTGAKKSLIGDLGQVETSTLPSRASKRKSSLATPIDLNESLQEDSLLKDDDNVHISPLKKSPASTKKTPLSARKSLGEIAKNSPVSTRKSVRKSLSEKLLLKAADRASNASSKKPSLLSDIDGISLLGSSLSTDDDDEVFATPAKFNTPASSKKSLLASLEQSSDSNGRMSAANTTGSTRRQSKRFIHLDSNKSVEENSETGTKKTPKSANKSLNSLQKTPASVGKTSHKSSSNVDLLLLAAADSLSKKSPASAKKSLLQENSPLIEGEISERKSVDLRKSQRSRLTVLDYEDYGPNDISTSSSRKSRSTSSRHSASLLEEAFKNNQFRTPENTPEADSKISRISSSKKSFNYGTPDSKWSNKTINSYVMDLEDSEVEAFRTRKSSSSKIIQEETPATPENEGHPFKTSTARKSSGQSRSLTIRAPIDEHNYFKRRSQSLPNVDVEDGSLIEDLEEVFPTKQLRTRKSPLVTNRVVKSHSLISLAQTPDRSGNSLKNSKLKDDSTFIDLDIPSPIYPDKRRTTSILSKCQTPDKSLRLAKSMVLSATKPGVRWSKSLVSIHTPDQSKMSPRSYKSTVQDLDDLSPEEIDLAASVVSNHTPNQSKISRHSDQISGKLDFSPSTKIPTSVQTSASKSRKSVGHESLTNNETQTRLSVSLVKTPDRIGSRKFSTHENSCQPTEIAASSSSRKSRSRKSTLDDETYLNNSEILSPTKTQARTSLSRKSSANESVQHLLEENQTLINPRMSSRSRKSTASIVNSSGVTLPDKMGTSSSESFNSQENDSILLSTSQEGSCLGDYPESTSQTEARDRMSSRSRASARVNETYTDQVDDLLSKSQGRMSSRSRKSIKKDSDDSLDLRMSKSLSTVQAANDSRSYKFSVQDSSDLEVNTEIDVSLSKMNQNLSKSRMSSRSRKSTASTVNSSGVAVSNKLENSSSESFNSQDNESIVLSTSQEGSCLEDYPESILSTSQNAARDRISFRSRASARVNETYTEKVDDLLSKSQTQYQGRMSSRSRKSTKKESDDSLRMSKSSSTVQPANDSRSCKSSAQDSSTLEANAERDVSLSKNIQTPSQTRLSSRSRKSTALDESDLNDSNVFSPNKTESRISVQNSNNSRLSSRSRKSSAQDSSALEANAESDVSLSKNIQTPSQTRISSRSRKSTALDENDLNYSDVFSPNKTESRISVQNSNNSRLLSRSRKSSAQDSSALEANAESDVSLSKNIQTPSQTRISSRSRKSTALDENDLNYSDVFSPNKTESRISVQNSNNSRLSSRSRKSSAQDSSALEANAKSDVSLSKNIQTPSQTRISSRSRKSTALDESDLNDLEVFSPNKEEGRKSKSVGAVQPSNDSTLSSRSLNELQDSDTFEAYSENDITLSKVETSSQDRMSHRSRKSTEVKSDLRDSNDLSSNKTETRKSKSLSAIQPFNDSRRSSRSRRSTVQDSDTPKADITFSKMEARSQDGMSYRSRKSTAVDEKGLNDSDVFSPNKAESRVSKSMTTVQPSNNSRLSSRSRISSVLNSSASEAYAESDVSLSKKNQTPSQTRTSSRSRKSSALDEIIDLNDSDAFSPNKTKSGKSTSLGSVQNSKNSRLSSKSRKSTVQDYSTFEAYNSNVSLSKIQTPSQAGTSYRSRKSAGVDETYNESNVDDFEDVPSPIQFNLRIANSVLSKTDTLDASRMSSKSPKFVANETNLQDLDFPSPIPLEKRRTKSLTSNVQTSDNRRSSRGRSSVSEYSKTQIDDYTVTESSEYPLGASRSKLNSDFEENEDEETIEENSINSKFVTKRMNRSLHQDFDKYSVEDNIEVPNVSLRNSKKAASNLTFTRPTTQDSSIISIDDTIENGNSEPTPYQPITEDITPASEKKTSKLQNNVTVAGIKNLFAGSPKNDLTKVPNLRRLMSPKQQNSPRNRLSDFTGVQRLLKSPPNSPLNDLTKVPNLRRLMSPREQKSPLNRLSDMYGVKNLLKTPGVVKKLTRKETLNRLSDSAEVAQIFNASAHRLSTTSDIENNEELFSKIFNKKPLKTYRSHSLGMSPEKIDAYGATRKSVLDKPLLSPRVSDWAEEQAALRQKLVEKLEDKRFSLTAEPHADVAVDEGTSLSSGKKRKLKNIEDDQKPAKKVKVLSTRSKKHLTEDNEEQTEHLSAGKEEIGESTELHPETEVDVSDNQECEDDNEITSQTIKKVKKKVTYVEEVTYYNISPAPGKTRRRKEAVTEPKQVTEVTEKKPAKSSKNKKYKLKNLEDFEAIQNLSSEKSEEVDEEPQQKKSQGRAMRSKKLDVLNKIESISEEIKETKTTRATRGKKQIAKEEKEEVDEQKEEVLVEAKAKKPTRTARGKKQIEAEKIEEEIEESKPARTVRGNRGKKQIESEEVEDEKVEESKPTRTVRGNRGKKQIESEEVEGEKIEESKPTRTVRGKKQIESEKIEEEVEKPKPTRAVRGKKQIEASKKEEEKVEESKPARAVRGKKQIEAEKVEEHNVEESKPTRTARGKKQIETEELEEQKVRESKPTRTLRGKKQMETEVEELKPKKPAKSGRGAKKQTTVEKEEEEENEPSSKSKRTKKDSVSEDLKEIQKSTRSARSKKEHIPEERETFSLSSEDDILEVKPNKSKKGKILETVINKLEDGVDETSSSKTTRKGGARAKKQEQVTNEDVGEKIVAKKPSKSNRSKNITKAAEENEEQNSEDDDVIVKRGKPVKALSKRNKKGSISEEQEPATKAGKKKRDDKEEENSNKRKKLEVAAEDTPTRTRSQRRALGK